MSSGCRNRQRLETRRGPKNEQRLVDVLPAYFDLVFYVEVCGCYVVGLLCDPLCEARAAC